MPRTSRKLRRLGASLFGLTIAATVVFAVVSSTYFWLAIGACGLTLLAGAYVDVDAKTRTRAVMAAAGITFTLLGLLPWLDLGKALLA